jgi:hypothetical protein
MTPVSVDPLIAIVTFPLFKICGFYAEVLENTYLSSINICCETAKFHFMYLFSQRSVFCASHLTTFNPLYVNGEPVLQAQS